MYVKIVFMNDPQFLVFCSWKKLQIYKNVFFFEKKFFQFIYGDKFFKTVCRNFLKIKGIRYILNFSGFTVPKIVLHNKVKKYKRKKIKEIRYTALETIIWQIIS